MTVDVQRQASRSGSAWAWRVALLGAAAALVLLLLWVPESEASHLRGGSIYAEPLGGNSVLVQGRFARTCAACPAVGTTAGWGTVTFGDSTSQTVYASVTASGAGWYEGSMATSSGSLGIPHTYPAASNGGTPWIVRYSGSARFNWGTGNHPNNPNDSIRLESTVDLMGTPDQPPIPTGPLVVDCASSALCVMPVPYTDGDAQPATLRWATALEATGSSSATWYLLGPCPPQSGAPGCGAVAAATLDIADPANLRVLWDTTGATTVSGACVHYSVQVMLEDGREKVPLDFLVRLGTCPIQPPPPPPPPPPQRSRSSTVTSPCFSIFRISRRDWVD